MCHRWCAPGQAVWGGQDGPKQGVAAGSPAFSWTLSPWGLGLEVKGKRVSFCRLQPRLCLLYWSLLWGGPDEVWRMELCGHSDPMSPVSGGSWWGCGPVVRGWAGLGRGRGMPFPTSRPGTCCPWRSGDVVSVIHSDIWDQLAKSWKGEKGRNRWGCSRATSAFFLGTRGPGRWLRLPSL